MSHSVAYIKLLVSEVNIYNTYTHKYVYWKHAGQATIFHIHSLYHGGVLGPFIYGSPIGEKTLSFSYIAGCIWSRDRHATPTTSPMKTTEQVLLLLSKKWISSDTIDSSKIDSTISSLLTHPTGSVSDRGWDLIRDLQKTDLRSSP